MMQSDVHVAVAKGLTARPRRSAGARLSSLWSQRRGLFVGSLGVILAVAIWELVGTLGLVDPILLSPPSAVARKFGDNFFRTGVIYPHVLASAQEAALGFALCIAIGVPLGILMGRVRLMREILDPFVMALYSAPMVALLPLFILWLGVGIWSKVMIIFLGGVFSIAINTQAGVESADRALIEVARSFTATRLQVLVKVVLPAAVPFIVAGIRLSIGRILIMVVVAEFYASSRGLGFLIMQAGATFDTAQVFVGVVILAGTSIGLSQLLRLLERRMAPWAHPGQE